MNSLHDPLISRLLVSIRKIIQAIDQHSISLKKDYGLTGPQLIVLQMIAAQEKIPVTQLSKDVSLSQATVTDITKRLESKGYLTKNRSSFDKRKINICLTEKGETALDTVPPLLQADFTDRFSKLENWEQLMIISAFERVVSMMSAADIDAGPYLMTGTADGDLM